MQIKELVVVEPGRIELEDGSLDEALGPEQALVQTEYSIVSAGTEGAGFTGLVKEMPFGDGGQYPRPTGYGNLGRVLAIGSEVTMCQEGDRVLRRGRWSRAGFCANGWSQYGLVALFGRPTGRYRTGYRHGVGG